MKKKQVISIVKKLTAGVLAIGMIVAGVVVCPKQAEAAVADKVIYIQSDENQTYDIKDYWDEDETQRKAPVKEGYVFGGWFTSADENVEGAELETGTTNYYAPLTEEDLKTAEPDSAYAKFVPAQVLSVKAQNEAKVKKSYIDSFTNEKDSFYVRVMTSLDSENYQKVGFDIYLGNWIKVYKDGTTDGATETNRIYRGAMVSTNDGENQRAATAEELFGSPSKYVGVWQLSEINYKENVSLIIYVRPYWITSDGTKVNGLAKYVHIEDEYLGYINVPVNLLGGEKVAAGAVNVTYNTNEQLELVAFEKGRIFEKMNHSYTDDKIVKIVGNTERQVGTYDDNGETIYANLRFKKPAATTEFSIVNEANKFCDWDENFVEVKKVWDTKYVQTTTNE